MTKNYPNSKKTNLKRNQWWLFTSALWFLFLTTLHSEAQTTETITTTGAGTWTVPCGVTSITVEAWGAGGGGYGDDNNNNITGRGGGGGAYTTATIAVTPGQLINYNVGTGGAAGNPVGGNGGNTTFLTLTAGGGVGGNVGAGGTGGIASGGTTNLNGGTSISTGSATNGATGGTGAGPGGGNGGAGGGDGANGSAGAIIAGGGGSSGDRSGGAESGGAGARGQITITYTSTCPTYCIPTSTGNTYPVSNVTFAGINNSSSAAVTAGPFYQDFSYITGSGVSGNTYNLSVTATGAAGNPFGVYAYFDWNYNGDFTDDAGNPYLIGTYTTATATVSANITIPFSVTGDVRFRVINQFNIVPPSCPSAGSYQAEDYSLNVTPPPACTAPTAQPSGLVLTPSGTTISGTFTAASPAPDSYLVVFNTTGAVPTPIDFTSYNIGNSINGSIVADNDSNTSFTIGGLNTNTTYYIFVFSFNGLCSGGPLYYTTSPLNGNSTTTAVTPTYCTPSTTNLATQIFIDDVSFLGTLNDTFNLNNGVDGATPGYDDFTGLTPLAIQAQGEGVNVSVEANSRGRWKAWVDWNKDGDFDDANEEVYDSNAATLTTTFGFVVPTNALPGNYRIRIRIYNSFYTTGPPPTTVESFAYDFNSCETFDNTNPLSAREYGEAEDYLFTVIPSCGANITSVTDGLICGTGTVDLNVTGTAGVIEYRWYANEFGGSPLATTATGTWTTPSLGATTSYWVTAYNGSCESLVRTEVIAQLNPIANLTFTPSTPEICGENNILSISASGDVETVYLIDEDFESGGLGVFTNVHLNSVPAINAQTAWQNEISTYIPGGLTWYPAVSSNFGANRFAFVTSDVGTGDLVDNVLLSPVVNSTNFTDLTLNFRMYYSRYFPDGNVTYDPIEYMQVQVSTNGGAAWTTVGGNIITDQGIGTRFADMSYDLSAYINQANLRIRIRYYADAWCDGAAVDDIQLFGSRPLNTAFDWTSALPVDAYLDPGATTTPYIPGTPAVTVYIRPTLAQLEQGTYTFTATAILSNGCSISDDVSIDNRSKVWKGSSSNDWSNPNNWSPVGVPDITNCVIIPDVTSTNPSVIFGGSYDAFGRTLQVKDDGILDIVSGNTLTIQNYVEVSPNGTFSIENSASLIQIDNVANTGNINKDRFAFTNSTLDYVYWSTPVAGFSVNNITPASPYVYQWEPTVPSAYAGDFGIWTAAAGAMTNGRGYIIRGSSGMTTFTGVPNNGDITIPISRSTYVGAPYAGPTTTLVTEDDDNWNLLGNPYPSAISADAFIAANTANIDSFVKIWTHGIDPSAATADPFYQDFVLNYSVADYITWNALGGTQSGYDGHIASSQGFFVLMNDAGATTENAIFNNTMRSNAYRNDQFYRTNEFSTESIEKHRIWLKLIAPSGSSSDALVGYVSDASNDYDTKYDAISGREKATFEIYSVLNNDTYSIQGKSLPFNDNDIVPLGVVVPENGIFTIALSKVDGLFEGNQDIFLEDLEVGTIYNIKRAPYTFMANAGRYNNRFVLRYTNESLTQDSFNTNNVFVYTNEAINITSTNNNIKEVVVYDLLGRSIYRNTNVNAKTLNISEINASNSGLIINITLDNGNVTSEKIIY